VVEQNHSTTLYVSCAGADAAMTSEMSLANPGVFQPIGQPRPPVDSVVKRLFEIVDKYGHLVHCVHRPLRAHLFKVREKLYLENTPTFLNKKKNTHIL